MELKHPFTMFELCTSTFCIQKFDCSLNNLHSTSVNRVFEHPSELQDATKMIGKQTSRVIPVFSAIVIPETETITFNEKEALR